MEKLEFCCGGSEETKSRPEAEETLVVRASGSVHQARSRPAQELGTKLSVSPPAWKGSNNWENGTSSESQQPT